jgi:phage FluMu protein Com
MARYIDRTCPRCKEYFSVTISRPTPEARVLPISASCSACDYKLEGWRVIVRRKQQADVRYGRVRKVFKR